METFETYMDAARGLFAGRPGFTEEVLEAIVATYLYLSDKYPDPVDPAAVPDYKSFPRKGQPPLTIAKIYMNRILMNVKSVEYTNESVPNKYDSVNNKIIISNANIASRKKGWYPLENPDDQNNFEKQIRAKIITHELLHAGSDNGLITGYSQTENNNYSPKFSTNQGEFWHLSRLEEMATEHLALEIVGSKRLEITPDAPIRFPSRNWSSSMCTIGCISEYFAVVFPECLTDKFINPEKFLIQMADNYSQSVFNYPPDKFLVGINELLKDMAREGKKPNAQNAEQLGHKYIFFQSKMLDYYISNVKLNTPDEIKKAIKDYMILSAYCVRTRKGERPPELQEKLDNLKQLCITACIKHNMDFTSIFDNTASEIIQTYNIKEPYADIKEKHTVKTKHIG